MQRTTSFSSTSGRNRTVLALAALVLMIIVGLSYRQWRHYSRGNADASQTREITDAVEQLLDSLVDAETGQRGYLLTGENRYLEPYNRTAEAIPTELTRLSGMLASRPSESANLARLQNLVNRKLAELRQTIELRRTQGSQPALAIVLSDQGKRTMDEIRTLAAEIQRKERSAQSRTSAEGEAAAQAGLMVTVGGSLVLLFLFAFGFEPFVTVDPPGQRRSSLLRLGAAVLSVTTATLLRMAMTPLIGPTAVPFITFFPAVLFVAWFSGFRLGALAILFSVLASDYFFMAPTKTLRIPNPGDQIVLIIFIVVGFGIAWLSHSQRQAVERATHAENAERVERRRFETTLASIGDAVIATDADARVSFANRVALSLTRWPEDKIIGGHLDEVFRIINEHTRAAVESPVRKVLREGAIVGLANHTVLVARDGTEVPIDDSAAPIRGETGAVEGTVLVFRDITARRRAEAASRLLASIVESSDDAIISKDLNGVITSWNKGAERMFGFSAEEMNGQSISVLAPPDRVDEMPFLQERIQRGERIEYFQTIRRTKSGELIHASVTLSPLYDAAGNIAGASKIVRDITAQIEAQTEVAEQRERLRVTLSSIGDAVMTTDTDGRISYLNPMAEQLTGWASEEAAGRPLDEVFRIVNEKSRQTVENPVTKVVREGRIVGLGNHTVLISRDGKKIAIDDSAAPIRDVGGELKGVVLVFRDVTERRATERLLATQTAELREKAHLMAGIHCFVRDLEDRIVYWNQAAVDLYGFSAGEAVGQTSHSLLKTAFPAPLEEIQAHLMAEGQWDGELVHTRRDGGAVTVASHWALHRDEEGRPASVLEVNTDITERKHVEKALRESEERYRATFASAAVGIAHVGLDGRWLRCNDAVCAITGYSHEELSAKTFADITHPDDIEADWELARRVAAGEIPTYSMEKRYVRKNGFTVWVNLSVSLLRGTDGSPQHFISIIQDVTARRQAEEKFHLAVEAAPNGMVVANGEGEIILVNSWTEKLFGYRRDELIGKRVEMLVPQRFRDSHQRYRQGFLDEPKARPMGAGRDLYGVRKDGSEFPVEIGLSPIQTDREMLVLGSIIDITERRESEATRRLLASVVESTADGVISEDLDGIVTSWNNAAEFIFGYSAGEMVGRPISIIIPPDRANEVLTVLDRVKKGERIAQYDTVRSAKGDRSIDVAVTYSPIRDAFGRIVGASKVVRDVTERKQMEEQRMELAAKERALASEKALRETEAELARVMRALSVGELATSIAHEVNQPLGGVVTNAEAGIRWLSGNAPNIEEAKQSLALIQRDGNRASAVVRRIREFLKKESPQTTSLDINEVLEEAVALARAELLKRQITLRLQPSTDLPPVHGDKIQLQQVILNLIMNGGEAMDTTAGPKELLVTSQESPGPGGHPGVLVAVRDSGVGIKPEDMQRMFDAFFTTRPTGMGMGLSISRSIIEAHGGRIWAEPNEGPGLTVQFSLPAERAGQQSSAAKEPV